MEEKKENLIVGKESENFMQYENKNVGINEEIRNMETNTNYANVEQKKDTELNYVSSVSTDGYKTNIPSTNIITQEELDNKYCRDVLEVDTPVYDFVGDDEDWSIFNETWDMLEDISQELSQDEVIYIGKFIDIQLTKSHKENMPMLECIFSVDDDGIMKKVKYVTAFPRYNNGYRFYEMNRLKESLLALGITRSMIYGDMSPRNIALALQPLVGKRIKISQYKQDSYNKYKIHGLVGGES